MKKRILTALIAMLILAGCSTAELENETITNDKEDRTRITQEETVEEKVIEESVNFEPDKPAWSSTGPSVFTSKKFKKITN